MSFPSSSITSNISGVPFMCLSLRDWYTEVLYTVRIFFRAELALGFVHIPMYVLRLTHKSFNWEVVGLATRVLRSD